MIYHTKNNVVLSLYMHTILALLYIESIYLLTELPALCRAVAEMIDRVDRLSRVGTFCPVDRSGQKVPRTVYPRIDGPRGPFFRSGGPVSQDLRSPWAGGPPPDRKWAGPVLRR